MEYGCVGRNTCRLRTEIVAMERKDKVSSRIHYINSGTVAHRRNDGHTSVLRQSFGGVNADHPVPTQGIVPARPDRSGRRKETPALLLLPDMSLWPRSPECRNIAPPEWEYRTLRRKKGKQIPWPVDKMPVIHGC